MFAVPGWSISSAQLKTQTVNTGDTQSKPNNARTKNSLSAKKRKRNHQESKAKGIDSADLVDLWEKVIEGKSKKKKSKKNDDKKSKKEILGDPTNNLVPQPITETVDPISKNSKSNGHKIAQSYSTLQSLCTGDLPQNNSQCDEKDTQKTKKLKNRARDLAVKDNEKEHKEIGKSLDKSELDPDVKVPGKSTPLTQLQTAMRQKLLSSRFRYLNETLYTASSSHSLKLFQENPEMFNEYHEGFRRQVEIWPENPVDTYISKIKKRGKVKKEANKEKSDEDELTLPLPRSGGICNIADLGCGDATLSASLQTQLKSLRLKIYSFDLYSISKLVTQADIAHLPLPDGSIDVAIFCLALMGTNWVDFIEEAFRILRWKGELWVAEIKSRFGRVLKDGNKIKEDSFRKNRQSALEKKKEAKRNEKMVEDAIAAAEIDGMNDMGEETNVSAFVEVLRKRGFALRSKENDALDLENKMFVKMCFTKSLTPIKGKYTSTPEFPGDSNGKTWKKKPKGQFIDHDSSQHISSEARVLKPCVYKLR
ncbi:25S rRNA -methyltransferase [Erysiphe neolycopersici]|uniref:Ribosomal RNA-processing protein 8 n=1 Tax=Erysiphe neolycopersici TaxID=212602 RepID=A0A420HWY9_9PEZI|nr:25S rRNA -methyltransferase [Erysiphe neolycopersici]